IHPKHTSSGGVFRVYVCIHTTISFLFPWRRRRVLQFSELLPQGGHYNAHTHIHTHPHRHTSSMHTPTHKRAHSHTHTRTKHARTHTHTRARAHSRAHA